MFPKSSTSNNNLVVGDLKVIDLKYIIEMITKLQPTEIKAFLDKNNIQAFKRYITTITTTDNTSSLTSEQSTPHEADVNRNRSTNKAIYPSPSPNPPKTPPPKEVELV